MRLFFGNVYRLGQRVRAWWEVAAGDSDLRVARREQVGMRLMRRHRTRILLPMQRSRQRGAMVKRKSATAMSGGQARARQLWRTVLIKGRGRSRDDNGRPGRVRKKGRWQERPLAKRVSSQMQTQITPIPMFSPLLRLRIARRRLSIAWSESEYLQPFCALLAFVVIVLAPIVVIVWRTVR
jgi:hypothetical protein